MDLEQTVASLWREVDRQNWGGLAAYFSPSAVIRWHNTNEQFTVDEFVRANSEYPGDWDIRIERVLAAGATVVSAVAVSAREGDVSFHAASFFGLKAAKLWSWTNIGATTRRRSGVWSWASAGRWRCDARR